MDKTEDTNNKDAIEAAAFASWYKSAANEPSFSARRWPTRKWDGSSSAFIELQKALHNNAKAQKTDDLHNEAMINIGGASLQLDTQQEIEGLVSDLQNYVDTKKKTAKSIDLAIALVEYIQYLVDDATVVIEEQEKRIQILERFNTTDLTTGLLNQAGFLQIFEKELDRCRRGKCEGGLIVNIDIDNLERIIEMHGQKVADLCLQKVARTIQNQVRMMDVAARIDDDEFIVLMTNTNKYEASDRAQEMAWQLGHLSLSHQGKEVPIWASLGLKTYAKGDMAESFMPEGATQREKSREDEHV